MESKTMELLYLISDTHYDRKKVDSLLKHLDSIDPVIVDICINRLPKKTFDNLINLIAN